MHNWFAGLAAAVQNWLVGWVAGMFQLGCWFAAQNPSWKLAAKDPIVGQAFCGLQVITRFGFRSICDNGIKSRAIYTGTPKKNVVHVSGYYEDRKENISTQRRLANKAGSCPVPPPNKGNEANKEVSDMEADFVVI
nr:hypothetical protein CFP56_72412 [Quercus suber]